VIGTDSLRHDFLTPSQKEEVKGKTAGETKQAIVDCCLVLNYQENQENQENNNNNY